MWGSLAIFEYVCMVVGMPCLLESKLKSIFYWNGLNLRNGSFPAYFYLFWSLQCHSSMFYLYKNLPKTGFEPRTSGVGSNRSANGATTTTFQMDFVLWAKAKKYLKRF